MDYTPKNYITIKNNRKLNYLFIIFITKEQLLIFCKLIIDSVSSFNGWFMVRHEVHWLSAEMELILGLGDSFNSEELFKWIDEDFLNAEW